MDIRTIHLSNLVPEVMAHRDLSASGLWLRDITFRRGQCCLIESASGGGKSSLCSFLYGLRKDYKGSIRFDAEPVKSFSTDRWCQLRRENIAFLPQEMRLFPELTAMENVLMKNDLTHALNPEEIREMFLILGLEGKSDRPCSTLSIGEQQRVAIIRTLCQPFDFLLLDEPVSHLDPENNRIASDMIINRSRQMNAGIIATSVGNPMFLPYDTTIRL